MRPPPRPQQEHGRHAGLCGIFHTCPTRPAPRASRPPSAILTRRPYQPHQYAHCLSRSMPSTAPRGNCPRMHPTPSRSRQDRAKGCDASPALSDIDALAGRRGPSVEECLKLEKDVLGLRRGQDNAFLGRGCRWLSPCVSGMVCATLACCDSPAC